MTNFRNSHGESFGDVVNRIAHQAILRARTKVTKAIYEIAREEITNLSNWDINKIGGGDLDLNVPPQHDPRNRGGKLSIRQAIEHDVDVQNIFHSEGQTDIYFGHISSLLSMSPRTLYYEFGTLGYTEVHETGTLSQYNISDFDTWQNPYIEVSQLRKSNRINQWGFRPTPNKGRFGIGYMVPAGGSVAAFPGIPPVRMYRNATYPTIARVRQIFSPLMDQVKSELGLA